MKNLFGNIYYKKRILITGHTGFKGSWMSLWLNEIGSDVTGISDKIPTNPSHFELLKLNINHIIGDIRNREFINDTVKKIKPEIIFHLAAQPLVRLSYDKPVETFETNVMGTIHLLEACKNVDTVKAIVIITSDKCYDNKEWVWGYRENDPMGGYDPYSASKGCAELVVSAWRNSFFNLEKYGSEHNVLLASARAGNVVGGGDWAGDRLIPDIIRTIEKNIPVTIRNPEATRPWQHVLEPVSGYLMLGQYLLMGKKEFAEGWNFGPSNEEIITVKQAVEQISKLWDKIKYRFGKEKNQPHEAGLLKLDCSKAHFKLQWKSIWNTAETFEKTILWYKKYYETGQIISSDHLRDYLNDAIKKEVKWTGK